MGFGQPYRDDSVTSIHYRICMYTQIGERERVLGAE